MPPVGDVSPRRVGLRYPRRDNAVVDWRLAPPSGLVRPLRGRALQRNRFV